MAIIFFFYIGKSGSEYFVAFPANFRNYRVLTLKLYISTSETEPVPFSVKTLRGFSFSGVVNTYTAAIIVLPDSFEVTNSSQRDKGIRISAGDKQIAVYGLSYRLGTSDSFSALLCSRQNVSEYAYYGVTYEDCSGGFSELLVVGCEDDTTVQIGSEVILLNQMETYLYTAEIDLTGTRVVSDKPLSFLSGHQCSNIPACVSSCDHIVEQLANTALWGRRYLSASLHTRNTNDMYTVVSYSSGTSVTFACSGQNLVTLSQFPNNHETVVVPNNAFCAIESNNPILVVQYSLGYGVDSIHIHGAPFMLTLPSIEQYSNDYAIIVPSEFSTNVITLYVPPEYYQPERIFVDEVSQIEANWIAIPCANRAICGYSAYVSVVTGEHSVYHDYENARIGVSVYGFASHYSYGHPAIGALPSVPLQGNAANMMTDII